MTQEMTQIQLVKIWITIMLEIHQMRIKKMKIQVKMMTSLDLSSSGEKLIQFLCDDLLDLG